MNLFFTAAALCLLYTAVSGSVYGRSQDCPSEEVVTGCFIRDGECACDSGCPPTIFPYRDEDACRRAVEVRNDDMCRARPCKNNGYCTQKRDGYKCFCHGTGHYGEHCELPCLRPARQRLVRDPDFPSECILMG
ncbi:protein crumbs homolog 1-like isoform X1 [Amphibalanus amphitrite]|uniref:protein crumbs homolog 1-like isoform X1 n=1 Tax=Amphibalanus amphitrite TaxID=1232801 RepID=UPI001C92980E|nr:protein crumbs homolog 1-like isoform X1 [Amphibalanus amphitrite]